MLFRSTVARASALVLGLGLVSAACGQYSISNIRALKAFKEGNDLYGRKDYKTAVARYHEVFERNPEFKGVAYFFLANSYDNLYKDSKKGEPENDAYLTKAIEHYKLAIEKIKDNDAPQAADVRKRSYEFLIAAYKDKMKDFAQAEPVAKQMIDMDPGDPTNYQVLGALYEDAGRYEDAEAMFVKSTQIKPNDPQVYSAIAGYYNRQGRFEKTMEALQKRADAEPNNPEAWHTIATYYSEKVTMDVGVKKVKAVEYTMAGITAADRALTINPEYADALTFKGILLRVQAKYETNVQKREALTKEAEELLVRSVKMREKQAGDAAKKSTAEAAKKGGKE